MPSIFISYSQDKADPTHGERVAGLAASLLQDGLKVFYDGSRGGEEEKFPWPLWMQSKVQEADHVLLICTELYLKKVCQEVAANEGRGVCWEANIIYVLLYETKLNTTKFLPVLFSLADVQFIPLVLRGKDYFVIDSQSGYERLYAFVTEQHRIHFPKPSATLRTVPQKTVQPLFASVGEVAISTRTVSGPDKLLSAGNPQLTLKSDIPPTPRQDIRGLDWYEECDAGHFLGRDKDANNILAMLLLHPIIRLVGPSGIGKSSLIRAGLLSKIREFGWRPCIIRPFENPARRIPPQLTMQLLTRAGAFTTPLDPAKFRAEVTPLLLRSGINRLVLFLDQFEDIISPVAAPDAVDAMRQFLGELWEMKESKPYLRAVVVYRTDADARLGRLWQEISGKSEGLPYVALQGLSRDVAEDIINQTVREQGWRLETSVPEIARQLALESQKLDCADEVFPVYLQIFLKQAQQSTEGQVTAEFITSLGGVSGLIGKYLEQVLAKLKARGGDWQQCGNVLESLSRSRGVNVVQSLDDLVRETGLSRTILAEMLRELINERLVRPIGHESYEIQHDRLASAVIESMKDSDRDAKAAREFLIAKVPAFEWTMVPLTPGELVYLYRHRQKIRPSERELQFLLASMLHNIEARTRSRSPGAYWLGESSPQNFLRWLLQIEHWAAKEDNSFRPSHDWVKRFPHFGLESQFAALAGDPVPFIRMLCVQWIGQTKRAEDLQQLRKLAKDKDWRVCAAALELLESLSGPEDMPLLRELSGDEDRRVRTAAVKALTTLTEKLASFSRPQDLSLLRELVKDQNWDVCAAAIKPLASFAETEDLPLLEELSKDQNWDVRAAAIKALANFSSVEALPRLRELAMEEQNWDVRMAAIKALITLIKTLASSSRLEVLPLLGELAKEQAGDVRVAAIQALANFSSPEALPLLRELTKEQNRHVRSLAMTGLASSSSPEVLPLLRELARDQDGTVRTRAIQALANFSKPEDLPLLRELAKDNERDVRTSAIKALANFTRLEVLALLRELAKDNERDVRTSAIKTLANFSKPEDLPLLRELAKDSDRDVRTAAIQALINFSCPEVLPSLRELAKEQDADTRTEMVKVLTILTDKVASFPWHSELPLLRELAKDQDWRVRGAALKLLASFAQAEDLPLLRELAKDNDRDVRTLMIKALASVAQAEDLLVLRDLAEDKDRDVRMAAIKSLASFSKLEALPLLRELTQNQNWEVRTAAIKSLANFSCPEVLPLLRELARDQDEDVRARAVEVLTTLTDTLPSFSWRNELPLLRELAKDQDWRVRETAAKLLASFAQAEDLPLVRQLAKDRDRNVCSAAIKALTSFAQVEDLLLLSEIAKDNDGVVRPVAIKALVTLTGTLASFSRPNDLPLLRELAKSQDSGLRARVMETLAGFPRSDALPVLCELALAPNDEVAAEAVRGLASRCSLEEIEVFLNQHDQQLCAAALAVLDELLYMPDWMKAIDSDQEKESNVDFGHTR